PAHTVPRLSSLRLPPSRLKAIACWRFTPARPVHPAASLRDFLSGALTLTGSLIEIAELRARINHQNVNPTAPTLVAHRYGTRPNARQRREIEGQVFALCQCAAARAQHQPRSLRFRDDA